MAAGMACGWIGATTALAIAVKTANFVLSSASALWGNPDCRFLSVTRITAEGSDLA
jgi:hypothetical protein